MDCRILLKFGRFVPYVSSEAAQLMKSTHLEIYDGGWPAIFKFLKYNNWTKKFFKFAEITYEGAVQCRSAKVAQ